MNHFPLKSTKLFEVFYDGACPLCRREIEWLKKKDRQNAIVFTDISEPEFDPRETGKTFDDLMARIHGRLPDGTVIEGVEVFRQLYSAIGFRRLVSLSRLPIIRHGLDLGYRIFAPIRTRLPGRHCQDACQATRENSSCSLKNR